MDKCDCYNIEELILEKYTMKGCGYYCEAWDKAKDFIKRNDNVEQHEPEDYACNCPNCGRCICGDCI